MYSKNDNGFQGKINLATTLDYGNYLYGENNNREGIVPPPIKGFLIQDSGFFILQDNGFLIEYT